MKAPRLKFFGVECTREEIWLLRQMSHYSNLDLGFVGRPIVAGDHVYPVKQPAADFSLRAKGLITYDKSKKQDVWTKLGAMYMERLARNNKRYRFYTTSGFCSRPTRMARKKNYGLWKEVL